MNQWDRFSWVMTERLPATTVAIELRGLLEYLDGSTDGSEADRKGLIAKAKAVLAEGGFLPLDEATDAALEAQALGADGSVGWYLAIAAAENADAELVLQAIETIPEGYFDDRGWHWRSVVLLELEAQARFLKGEAARVAELAARLNAVYRADDESGDGRIPRPRRLMAMLFSQRTAWPLLASLLSGLDLEWWVDPEHRGEYAEALAAIPH